MRDPNIRLNDLVDDDFDDPGRHQLQRSGAHRAEQRGNRQPLVWPKILKDAEQGFHNNRPDGYVR